MNIDHIAIVVNNLDDALNVYRDALGLTVKHIEDVPEEHVKVAFLPFADGKHDIELLEPTAPDTGVSKFLAKRGEGIHHICVTVDNIEESMADLSAKGLQILEEKPRVGSQGQKYVFVHPKTTHGVLIELYQKANER